MFCLVFTLHGVEYRNFGNIILNLCPLLPERVMSILKHKFYIFFTVFGFAVFSSKFGLGYLWLVVAFLPLETFYSLFCWVLPLSFCHWFLILFYFFIVAMFVFFISSIRSFPSFMSAVISFIVFFSNSRYLLTCLVVPLVFTLLRWIHLTL